MTDERSASTPDLAGLRRAPLDPPGPLELFRQLEIALYGKDGNTWEVERAERVMDVLRAALRARPSDWQPIATAPRDKTRILTSTGEGRCEVLRFEDGEWTDGEYTYCPTHWMSLPNPPVGAPPPATEEPPQ